MKYYLPVLLWLFVSACNHQPAATDNNTSGNTAEKILGLSFDNEKEEVTMTVVSNGCTSKADFKFEINTNTIKIVRLKKDECKRVPEAIDLVFSCREAGIDPAKAYTVVNSFVPNLNLVDVH